MPIYVYKCEKCGFEFEELVLKKSDVPKKCPKCRSKKVKRKITFSGGFVFKGKGFYETDYKKKK